MAMLLGSSSMWSRPRPSAELLKVSVGSYVNSAGTVGRRTISESLPFPNHGALL